MGILCIFSRDTKIKNSILREKLHGRSQCFPGDIPSYPRFSCQEKKKKKKKKEEEEEEEEKLFVTQLKKIMSDR